MTALRQVSNRSSNLKPRTLPLRWIVKQSRWYAWQSAKNCVKRLIGRKPWEGYRRLFVRQYILHAVGLSPMRAISSAFNRPSEGPGSQALSVMSTITFARAHRLDYLHAPFTAISGADRPMAEWAAAWEAVFNLGAGEASYDAARRGVFKVGDCLVYVYLEFGGSEERKTLEHCFKTLIPEFRRKYYLNKSPRTSDLVTVAVNIRRGEVSAHQHSSMYTSSEKIVQLARTLKAILDSQGVAFSLRVYGQGTNAEFAELFPLGAEFFLNADPIWTFQELVEADILIVSKSCFSHYAGLICDGIKIFEEPLKRMPATALEDWLPCQSDGSLDRAAFERRLSKLLEDKKQARLG